MLLTTLRGMLAHKLRLVLTTVSIMLGVAFLAGTLMLTDTIKVAFDQVFGRLGAGTDVVVRSEPAYQGTAAAGDTRQPVPAQLLDTVRSVDGVAAAEGYTSGYALVTDPSGRAVLPSSGAPTYGYSMPADAGLRGELELRSGRAPAAPGEVAVDATAAREGGIAVGSTISVLFRGPTEQFTVVGVVGFGAEDDLGGSTAAYFDPDTAQRVLGEPGEFDEVHVRAADGVSDAELVARVAAVAPQGVEAVTGTSVAQESADAINDQFEFLDVLLLLFAGISLFVGSFIIWNTFTMIVSQRSREIALLRAIGATRRQVNRSLLAEAAVLGAVASALGVVLGAGVAAGLTALMSAVGFSLPSADLQVLPRTIWLSILVGTSVTVLAALVPARRATRVLPVEALRQAAPGARQPSRTRAVIGVVVTGGGVAAILTGLSGAVAAGPVLLGIAATLVGVLTLLPLVARPLARLIGAPLRASGVAGELARQNAMRNPRRTAATAAALMIGLTLVISVGVFASSLKASFGTVLDDSLTADLYVTTASTQAEGFSPEVADVVADVPGVATVSPTGWGTARFEGAESAFSSIDPATAATVLRLDLTSGSAAGLGTDGVLVSAAAAATHGWRVGDTVAAEFVATGTQSLQVRGVYGTGGFLDGDYVISTATQEANQPERLDTAALVRVDPDTDTAVVQARIAEALAEHPDAQVLDRAQYEERLGGVVDQLLAFVSVLLLLAVVIALLGIVNTLALSVFERRRELGLLRAIGMTRGQVRAMVRWEAVVISLVGAAVGAGLGIGLGIALAQALRDQGITEVAVAPVQVLGYVAAAAVASVLAAVGPARSAARVDVLTAVAGD